MATRTTFETKTGRGTLTLVSRLLLCGAAGVLLMGSHGCPHVDEEGSEFDFFKALSEAAFGNRTAPPPPAEAPGERFAEAVLEGQPNDDLTGTSVAVTGSALAAGAPGIWDADVPPTGAGGIIGGALVQPDANPNVHQVVASEADQYVDMEAGTAVAVRPGMLIVGAPHARVMRTDSSIVASGALFVYLLQPSVPPVFDHRVDPVLINSGDEFGAAVAMDGDTLVVGAPNADIAGADSGGAYVYGFDGSRWNFAQELIPSVEEAGDRFGSAVAIDGDQLIVGAPGALAGQGAAYVYARFANRWVRQTQLTARVEPAPVAFGSAVDIDGVTAVVGASAESSGRGAAYVFEREGQTWTQVERLSEGGGVDELFGASVGISGNLLVVGRPGLGPVGQAVVYEQQSGNWSLLDRLAPVESTSGRRVVGFGSSVAIDGNTFMVGAPGNAQAFVYTDQGPQKTGPAKKKRDRTATNSYLGFTPKPKAPDRLTGTRYLPRALWVPFSAEVSAGAFDARREDDLTDAGFDVGVGTLDEENGPSFGVRGVFVGSGIEIQGHTEAGPVGETLFLPGTRIATVAITHDGGAVTLAARAFGSTAFRELARIPAQTQKTPFTAYINAANVARGTEMGFDDPVVEVTGNPLPGQTPAEELRDIVFDAAVATIAGSGELEQRTPDRDAAKIELKRAMTTLDQALGAASAILADPPIASKRNDPNKAVKKAGKYIRRAWKRVRKSISGLQTGKSTRAVLNQVAKARKEEQKALAALLR